MKQNVTCLKGEWVINKCVLNTLDFNIFIAFTAVVLFIISCHPFKIF